MLSSPIGSTPASTSSAQVSFERRAVLRFGDMAKCPWVLVALILREEAAAGKAGRKRLRKVCRIIPSLKPNAQARNVGL